MDDVIELVSRTFTKDDYGAETVAEQKRQVYATVLSVTRAEFFDGGRNGLNPQFQFTIFRGDYDGEEVCEFHGNRYAIYRTYIVPNSDYLELYVERKGGTNG